MTARQIAVRIFLISITIILLATKALSSPVDTVGHNCSTHHNVAAVSNVLSSGSNEGGNAMGFVGQEKNLTISNGTMMKGGSGKNSSSCEHCQTGAASSPKLTIAKKIFITLWISITIALIMLR
ncbi:beta-glucosidase [Hypoxylon texense]